MGHVVHYRDASGASHLDDVPSTEAAVELIERLRNEDGAEDVRLFREVPLKVRTYYKVAVDEPEVPDEAAPAQAPAPGDTAGEEPPPGAMNLTPPPAVTPTATGAGAADDEGDHNGPRRGSLFNRG